MSAPVTKPQVPPERAVAFRAGWMFLWPLVASAIAWLLAWYGDTVQSMVSTWVHSETFAHGFLILPISAWLVWRRRHDIQALRPKPSIWTLIPLAGVCFVWVLGQLAAVVIVQQYSLVLMMLLLVATIVGTRVAKELAFPLLFLLFAVPFGEFLLPELMEHTANFTVFALRLTGIPVYREGLYFTVPSGNWSVVEACSGLRYLIASLTLGVLYAYLTYRRLSRRIIFVALSIIVPIVANWLRAYMIVMIGHLTSMKHAVGVDHLIYGWVFFGVVMMILFWVGSYWREDHDPLQTGATVLSGVPSGQFAWRGILMATLAVAATVTVSPSVVSYLQRGAHRQPVLETPLGRGEWRSEPGTLADWTPHFLNPRARISQLYVSGSRQVELYVGFYRNQRQSAELIASQNVLVHSTDKIWGNIGETPRSINVDNNEISIVEARLRNRDTRLLVWYWYWIDGHYTSNPYWAKALQAKSQLLGRGDDAAVVVLSAKFDLNAQDAVGALQDFASIMIPAVDDHLQHVR